MIFKSNLVNEIKVSIKYFCWSMTAQNLNKQCYYSFYDKRITISRKLKFTIYKIALQPNTTLTTINQIAVVLVFIINNIQFISQINKHLVFIHPVGKVFKLLYHFILGFIYGHIILSPLFR